MYVNLLLVKTVIHTDLQINVLKTIHQKKSHLHYTRGITLKRVTTDVAHLRGLTPEQHSRAHQNSTLRQPVRILKKMFP